MQTLATLVLQVLTSRYRRILAAAVHEPDHQSDGGDSDRDIPQNQVLELKLIDLRAI